MGVSLVQVQQRTTRFVEFMRAHSISSISLSSSLSMKPQFLLFIEGTQEIALVHLVNLSRTYVTTYEGALKTLLFSWSEQEHRSLVLDIHATDLEKLEVLRETLLHPSPHRLPTPSLWGNEGMQTPPIRLSSDDGPLIDLAQRLGYSVFLTTSNGPPFHPYYCIFDAHASALLAEGRSLVSVLAELLLQQQDNKQEQALPPSSL